MKIPYAAVLLAASSAAQLFDTGPRIDRNLAHGSNGTINPFGPVPFNNAGPNATREVTFPRGQHNWTWTLEISEIEIPDSPDATEYISSWNAAPGSHVAFTTSKFNWPQEGNINQVVRGEHPGDARSTTSCFYNVWAEFPENVTSAWDSSNSSCASAIGEECERYITGSLINREGCESNNLGQLQFRRFCPGIWGRGRAVFGFTFGNASTPSNETAFESGDTISWTLSDLMSPGNDTAFDNAKNRLYMVIMRNPEGTQVLCNRIASADTSAGTRVAGVNTLLMGFSALAIIGLVGL